MPKDSYENSDSKTKPMMCQICGVGQGCAHPCHKTNSEAIV